MGFWKKNLLWLLCNVSDRSLQAPAGSVPPALWRLAPQLPSGAPPSPPPAAQLPPPPGQPGERLQHGGWAQGDGGLHPRDLRQQRQRVRVVRFFSADGRLWFSQSWKLPFKPIWTVTGPIRADQTPRRQEPDHVLWLWVDDKKERMHLKSTTGCYVLALGWPWLSIIERQKSTAPKIHYF